ncbi:MAG: hypothetical protein QXT45_04320 [Candidatus Bilamarchaeaceae archaeon]
MIGLLIQHDGVVRVGDKIRIDASKTFATKGHPSITKVEIRPDSSSSFIDVSGPGPSLNPKNWFLDWVYQTDGIKNIELLVTDSATNTHSTTSTITALLPQDDKLFADDHDILAYDSDILSYLPESRSSWRHIHREVKTLILAHLRDRRIRNPDGTDLDFDQIKISSQLRELAAIWSLKIIYWNLSNKIDDKFFQKHQETAKMLATLLSRGDLGIDFDTDGQISELERVDLRSKFLTRQ